MCSLKVRKFAECVILLAGRYHALGDSPDDGPDLRAYLDLLGWSQSHFAERVGVHPNTVSKWATGKAAIPGPVNAYLALAVRVWEMRKLVD